MLPSPPRSTRFPYTTRFRSPPHWPPRGTGAPCWPGRACWPTSDVKSEEHTSELQSQSNLVCRLLLEKKKFEHGEDVVGESGGMGVTERQPAKQLIPAVEQYF